MATKKAKKTSAKKSVTKIKSVSSTDKSSVAESSIKKWKKVKDIRNDDATISTLIVELIGTFIITLPIFLTSPLSFVFRTMPTAIVLPIFLLTNFLFIFGTVAIFGKYTKTFFNPLVSIGQFIMNRISGLKAILTIVAQILGAMLASTVVRFYINNSGMEVKTPLPVAKQGSQEQKIHKENISLPKLQKLYTQSEKEVTKELEKQNIPKEEYNTEKIKKAIEDIKPIEKKESRLTSVFMYQLIVSLIFGILIAHAWKKDILTTAAIAGFATTISMTIGQMLSMLSGQRVIFIEGWSFMSENIHPMTGSGSGSILNPASLFLFNGSEVSFWSQTLPLYILAPILGSAIGFFIASKLKKEIKTA